MKRLLAVIALCIACTYFGFSLGVYAGRASATADNLREYAKWNAIRNEQIKVITENTVPATRPAVD